MGPHYVVCPAALVLAHEYAAEPVLSELTNGFVHHCVV